MPLNPKIVPQKHKRSTSEVHESIKVKNGKNSCTRLTPNKQGRKNSNNKKPKANIMSTSSNSSIVKQAMQPKIFEVPSHLK